MFNTLAARDALIEEKIPVMGLAVVDRPHDSPSPHSFIQCGDDIVSVHWGAAFPDDRTIQRAAGVIGHYADPPCMSPVVLER